MAPGGGLHPSAEWNQLDNRFYRKQELYSMLWQDMKLNVFRVAASTFGGPIALLRDDSKIIAAQKQTAKQTLMFYTAAGKLMNQIPWDKGRLVGMGWTDEEKLLCVMDDGTVRMYSLHGEPKGFSLGKDAKDHGVEDCRIWGSGFVFLTGNFLMFAVTNLEEPRPRQLANMGLNEPPHSWAVIEPQYTLSRNVEVLVATRDTILVVDATDAQDQMLRTGPYKRMAVSPNGKLLALFTADGNLQVVATDFQRNLSTFSTKSSVPPNQLVWCANDSVVLYWDNIVLMVGPYGDYRDYKYDDAVYLVPEIDGVRIVGSDKTEFLQLVPKVTEAIFKIGSTASAAMLYDALEHFERKSPKADENLRSIKGELPEAVDACLEAAGYEFNPYYQRMLLKAASFGKCFIENASPDKFVEMCRTLRVLNAVRHYEIGICLTEPQFRRLTPAVLIDRLINRDHHLLALRVAEYLSMKTERILVHWACQKVKRAEADDETVCRIIVEKLADQKGISYAEIAQTAYNQGRPHLATKLLDNEPRAAQQVPLLIDMQEDEMALGKAIDSGDTELVYFVLLHLKRKLSPGDFFRLVDTKPLAAALLEVYCKQQDLDLLKDFYYHDDRRHESALVTILEGYEAKDMSKRLSSLKVAADMLKEDAFMARQTEEQIRLLEVQVALQKQTKEPFVGLSLAQTIYTCLTKGMPNEAIKIKGDFKMADKQFWWLKIKATAEKRDWEELDRFSKSKKSPIGYEPFVAECMNQQATKEALKYIPRCEPPQRAALFLRVGAFNEAAEAAFIQKDTEMLLEVKQKCGNPKLAAGIDAMLAQITQRR